MMRAESAHHFWGGGLDFAIKMATRASTRQLRKTARFETPIMACSRGYQEELGVVFCDGRRRKPAVDAPQSIRVTARGRLVMILAACWFCVVRRLKWRIRW